WKKNNKSKLNLCKTFSTTCDNWLHTKEEQVYITVEQHPRIEDLDYVVVSIDKENLEPTILTKIDNPFPDCVFHPYDSCNGLILLLYDNIWGKDPDISQEAIWNPTTNKLKIIPTSPFTLDPYKNYKKKICNHFGFGYDSTCNDYKVIRFLERYDRSLAVAELYSLKTNSWKHVYFNPISLYPYGDPFAKIHANGTYYRLDIVDLNYIDSNSIRPFNFATEEFDSLYIPIPPTDKLNRYKFCHMKLVEYWGSLGFLASTSMWVDGVKYNDFELWVWDDANLLWRLESTFLVNKMHSFMGLFENDKLFYLQLGLGGHLTVQDCAMNKVMNLSNVCSQRVGKIFPFVENYVSLSSYGK
ncbi:F-box protein, partial [Striga asiatica]